jgi:hypothetical protein
MGMFIITPDNAAALKTASARARAHPIPWAVLQSAVLPDKLEVTLEDRAATVEVARHSQERVTLASGHRVNINWEEQPSGLCLHLSCSSPGEEALKLLPVPAAIDMLVDTILGKKDWPGTCWIEEFRGPDGAYAGRAVNVCVLVEPRDGPREGDVVQ